MRKTVDLMRFSTRINFALTFAMEFSTLEINSAIELFTLSESENLITQKENVFRDNDINCHVKNFIIFLIII